MATDDGGPPPIKRGITKEEDIGLFTLINRARAANGWILESAKNLEPTIKVWFQIFRDYNIPVDAYDELFKRAFDVRQQLLREGKKRNEIPDMDATLLVSRWTGEYGVASLREQERRRSGRILVDVNASSCLRCGGSGGERVFNNETGKFLGRKPGTCEHKQLEEHEWLYKQREDGVFNIKV
jgi:hypothetical protein